MAWNWLEAVFVTLAVLVVIFVLGFSLGFGCVSVSIFCGMETTKRWASLKPLLGAGFKRFLFKEAHQI